MHRQAGDLGILRFVSGVYKVDGRTVALYPGVQIVDLKTTFNRHE